MVISKTIIVKGKVQGVNFRYYTKQEALKLGLSGTVMNLDNGDVKIRVEGEENSVNSLVQWTRIGPPRASVEGIEIQESPVRGFREFSILR